MGINFITVSSLPLSTTRGKQFLKIRVEPYTTTTKTILKPRI